MYQDNFPLDCHHWLIGVSFPVVHLGAKQALLAEVDRLAESRGGRPHTRSEPAPGYIGRPGCATFGCAVAFEAHDANADAFVRLVEDRLARFGVTVSHDPECIYAPDEDFGADAEEDLAPVACGMRR